MVLRLIILNNILIFGGTFDPIHYGHLNIAINIQNFFSFNKFIFLPCKQSLLKNIPHTTIYHRITMLNLALTESQQHTNYNFTLDLHEITRSTPSYTAITLQNYRKIYGTNTAITLMMGTDSFYQLPLWEDWQNFLNWSNLLIVNRHDKTESLCSTLQKLLDAHETKQPEQLLTTAHGVIYQFNAGNYAISSTMLRQQFSQQEHDVNKKLPQSIYDYIISHQLYTNN